MRMRSDCQEDIFIKSYDIDKLSNALMNSSDLDSLSRYSSLRFDSDTIPVLKKRSHHYLNTLKVCRERARMENLN